MPGFDALCEMERRLGLSALQLARRLSDGAMTLNELATVIELCCPTARDALMRGRLTQAIETAADMFAQLFQGETMSRAELNELREKFPDVISADCSTGS